MAIYKCKMCGASLNVNDGVTVIECEYCGTKQTVPTAAEEAIQSLFNRAGVLRLKGEYDKAEDIYEKIIAANGKEAEAYWGVLLCRYGIEYVEDPSTSERKPTCHRTRRESILDEVYFENALSCADEVQKAIYRREASAIDAVQKKILEIAANEKPYDIFICYKESDSQGKKTVDSSLADEIYYELNEEGYRVFFAPVTLKSKLGSEYEPIIYSALASAKVMVALGTRPEYFNAVWVKNEWSRFLKMMNGTGKKLIPCYRDMDAYELPEEFAHLQALDMSGIGFARELVKNIERLIGLPKKNAPETAQTVSSGAARTVSGEVEAQLKRAYIFLSDAEFDKASEYCEKVLDRLPECASAYLCKALAKMRIADRDQISKKLDVLLGDNDFEKARRFAEGELKEELEAAVEKHLADIEYARNDAIYEKAASCFCKAKTVGEYEEAQKQFREIKGHRDADKLADKCEEEIERLLVSVRKEADRLEPFRKRARLCDGLVMLYCTRLHVLCDDGSVSEFEHLVKNGAYYSMKVNNNDFGDTKLSRIYPDYIELLNGEKVLHFSDRLNDKLNGKKNITEIVKISYGCAVLNGDGTVIYLHDRVSDKAYEEAVKSWENVVKLENIRGMLVGIRSDGKLYVVGKDDDGCGKAIAAWTCIASLCGNGQNAYGITKNGEVRAWGKVSEKYGDQIKTWRNVIKVVPRGGWAQHDQPVALTSDGRVLGIEGFLPPEVKEWDDIVDIQDVNGLYIVGLKSNGSVVYAHYNCRSKSVYSNALKTYIQSEKEPYTESELKKDDETYTVSSVLGWHNVVAIVDADNVLIGILEDGRIVGTMARYTNYAENIRLFNSPETIDSDRVKAIADAGRRAEEAEKKRIEEERRKKEVEAAKAREEKERKEKIRKAWISNGLCQYCGGSFKGLFGKKCSLCERPKDY